MSDHDLEPLAKPTSVKANHESAHEPQLLQNGATAAPAATGRLELQPAGALDFTSVVGQQSVPKSISISNPSMQVLGIVPELQGVNAEAFGQNGHALLKVKPESSAGGQVVIDVWYRPHAEGQHTAALVLRDSAGARYAVPLTGTAIATSNTAAYRGEGEHDVTVRDVEHKEAPANRKEAKAQLGEAIDAVAQVPRAFNRMAQANDTARDVFATKIESAAESLTGRITAWVAQEGIASAQSFKDHPGNALMSFIRDTAIELGLDALGPLGKLSTMVLAIALDVRDTLETNQKANDQTGKLVGVGQLAVRSVGESTRMFMQIYGHVLNGYTDTRRSCAHRAGVDAPKLLNALGALQKKPTLSNEEVARNVVEARALVDDFQSAQQVHAQAFRSLAGAGNNAKQVADQSLSRILDRYLTYRVTGSTQPTAEAAEKQRVEGRGWINFDVARAKSENGLSVGYDARFGSYAPESATMARHLAGKNIWGEQGWAVKISLKMATGEGGVVLQQDADGQRHLLPWGDAVAQVHRVGKDAIWNEVVGHR